ncbi:sugar lactone lactonase YvrE [Novosphingobium sp. PhB165]|uniref:SMP-30/gluconolactonase/LRE family protein n=1 Tax=Novosphingobium sp. PhB165 TaxID=2485105 RepID=UPI0010488260|nr:SMP-30/gluconolactonase/LRE family protein [Novosphingobium sp. PhB165]TCM20505.1 sugar lactone lactonase YvrE [Novosphingobium sp. PhB165]
MTPESVLSVGATLGEGPVWAGDRLWFVDIKAHRLYRHDPATGALDTWQAPDQIGWVLPAARGDMITGIKTGLHRFNPETGQFALLHNPEPTRPHNRLNDAATDPAGRIWLGSMDDAETEASGALYRLDKGHCTDSGLPKVVITNGPAISADGRTLWHTDTLGKTIWRVPVREDGTLGTPEHFVTIEDGAGWPDGSVIDAEGCFWTGLFGGWGVRRYDPSGKLIATVRFPVANVTKIAFGGPDLRTAYATTARKGLSAAELEAQPLAGNVFAFDPGVAGLPVHLANS